MNILYFLFVLLSTSSTVLSAVDGIQSGIVRFSGTIIEVGRCEVAQEGNNSLKQRCYRSGQSEQSVIQPKKKAWLLPLSLGNIEYAKLSPKHAIVKITYD